MLTLIYKIPISYYAITALVNFLTSAGLGLFIYYKNRNVSTNKIFAFFCLTVAQWSLFYYIWLSVKDIRTAEFYLRTCMIGVVFMPVVFTHFIFHLLNLKINRKVFYINYFVSIIIVSTIYTPLYATDFKPFLVFPCWGLAGVIFPLHLLQFFLNVLYSHYKMIVVIRKSNNLIVKKQLTFVFVGTVMGYLGGIANYLCWYRIPFPPVPNILVSIYVALVAYAIVRHRLMNIEVIVKKTLVFTGLSASLLGVIVIISFVLQEILSKFIVMPKTLSYAVMLIIAIALYEPIKKFLVRVTDKYLFQKKYDPRQVVRSFIDYAATALDLDEIVSETNGLLDKTIHPNFSSILLSNSDDYVSHGIKDKSGVITINNNSAIVAYLKSAKDIVSIEDENDKKISEEIKSEMLRLKASLAVPLLIRDELIGIMLLGKKKSDEYYTLEDLNMLMDLARTLAIALKNAEFVKERDAMHLEMTQAKLKEELATMAYGMSHQFNNKFQGIAMTVRCAKTLYYKPIFLLKSKTIYKLSLTI